MKYRIVELYSGKYQIQFKSKLFSEWESLEFFFNTRNDAKIAFDSIRKNKVKNIIEVINETN